MASTINPLSYNAYIQQIGVMAVVTVQESTGVYVGVDPAFNTLIPQMLAYAENRISRDLDLLAAQTSNTYTLTAGTPALQIPITDFLAVQTVSIAQIAGGKTVSESPLLPTSREFIQNVYGGIGNQGQPKYYAMTGDNFGDGADTYNNILLGPTPNYAYTVRISGAIRPPSLYSYAVTGVADTSYTYISQYLPDLLVMASMVYISAFQRNFSATSDDVEMSMSYEKQYQILRLGAVPEENRKKQMGSAWSGYSTPTAATPTR